MTIMHVCKNNKSNHGMGTKTRARKSTTTDYYYYSQALNHSSTSRDTAPQHSFKRKEKATLIDEWQTGSVDLYVAWSLDDRTSPTRPILVTCILVVRW